MKELKSLALVLVVLGAALFFACNKENTDTTNIIEDPTRTDTIGINCDSQTIAIKGSYDSATAILTAYRTGGVQPFRYLWSTGDTTQTIRVTNTGIYSVKVKDALGCEKSDAFSVVIPSNPCFNLQVRITQTSGTTILVANTTGGTAPYTYRWSTGATTQSIISSGNGTYSVTITDRNGCVATHQTTIGSSVNCAAFKATIHAFDSTRFALAWVATTNGTSPYTYKWSTGSTASNIGITTNGAYRVTVTDANRCTATDELNVAWSPTCGTMTLRFHLNDTIGLPHLLAAIPERGTVPYTYHWSTNAIGNFIPVTSGNAYQLTVTDARGCSIIGSYQY